MRQVFAISTKFGSEFLKRRKKLEIYNRLQEVRHACSDCPICVNDILT